jgi:hypothetical protein
MGALTCLPSEFGGGEDESRSTLLLDLRWVQICSSRSGATSLAAGAVLTSSFTAGRRAQRQQLAR